MVEQEPFRRREGDRTGPGAAPAPVLTWVKTNYILLGVGGSLLAGFIFGVTLYNRISDTLPLFTVVFYEKVSSTLPIVTKLQTDLAASQLSLNQLTQDVSDLKTRVSELRIHLDKSLELADAVREKLRDTDSQATAVMGRMDERLKNLEGKAPLAQFTPPPGRSR